MSSKTSEVGSNSANISSLSLKDSNFSVNDDCSLKVFDKPVESLNVVDVYNIASSVGQEFERLTEAFGGVVFTQVMPKIIRVLEMLETLVSTHEDDVSKFNELQVSLENLLAENKLKDKKQLEEIEIIESTWKDETRGLLETVSTLEDDNKKLTAVLTENLIKESNYDVEIPEQQASMINKLQQQISNQKDELKSRAASLEEQGVEIDALQSQVQRLSNLNVEIRNKVSILEQQAKTLITEKASLEAKLEKGLSITELQLKSYKSEKVTKSDDANREDDSASNPVEPNAPLDPLLANKLVIDLNDPNRPRYTLQELQEVLDDRNQLKARCFLLEEELIYHRGEGWEELNEVEISQSKLFAKKEPTPAPESGIRKFFHFLTGDTSWRHRTPAAPEPQTHEIVENEMTSQNLVNPDDLRELVPDADEVREITRLYEESDKPRSTEMSVVYSMDERLDLSP